LTDSGLHAPIGSRAGSGVGAGTHATRARAFACAAHCRQRWWRGAGEAARTRGDRADACGGAGDAVTLSSRRRARRARRVRV